MLNKIQLIGRIGKDPESQQFGDSTKTWFSLATSEKYNDKSGTKQEVTQWHNVVIWGKLAEIAQKYLKKGELIYIGGQVEYRKFDKDGQTRYITEIKATEMKMLGTAGGGGKAEPESNINSEYRAAPQSDDIPF